MKTAHATIHGTMSPVDMHGRQRITLHGAVVRVEQAVIMSVLLSCEFVILWLLISSMYLSEWPVR